MNTCGNCKWWDKDGYAPGWGVCECAEACTQVACIQLITKPDFACPHYEPQEEIK